MEAKQTSRLRPAEFAARRRLRKVFESGSRRYGISAFSLNNNVLIVPLFLADDGLASGV
jgi:hypothetical protein